MISVVIPTYNEARNISDLLQEVSSVLSDRDTEFVIVDDNSSDGTADIIRDMDSEIDKLNLVERKGESGIGSAYKRGFREAEGDIILQMDADFSHRPEDIPKLVSAIENGSEAVVGSRYVEGGDRNDPLLRRINPWIGRFLYTYLLKCPVKDFTSGFKAYRRQIIGDLTDSKLPDGFHFQAASLMRLVRKNKDIKEVPIDFRPRRAGEPKYNVRDLADNAELFVRLFMEQNKELIKFGIVGTSGVLANMGLLYFLTEHLGVHYLLSSVLAVESAIVSNFVLNEFWTFVEKGEDSLKHLVGRFGKFNSISLVGLGINVAILWTLTEFAGLYYLFSNLLAIAVVFIWNYAANVKWTWTE